MCGIRNESTQRKLLSQERNFEQALQTAIAEEIVESEAKAIHNQVNGNARPTATIVNSVKDKSHGRFNNNKRGAHGKQANSLKSQLCFCVFVT